MIGNVAAIVVVAWIAAVVALPMLWLVLTSFKSPQDITSLTPTFLFAPTLDNYRAILASPDAAILHAMVNSLLVSVVSTVVSVALAAMAAYGLARLKPPGHGFLGLLIFGMRMLPPVALVVPLFFMATGPASSIRGCR
jgi:multiple sugar transport system permease protein